MLDLPDFKDAKHVTLDVETHDPELKAKGPGVRRDGHLVGVAFNIENERLDYLPVGHRVGANVDKPAVVNWLKKNLRQFKGRLHGANLLYDMDYLAEEGVEAPTAKWCDIQTAEPLLDEGKFTYSLDSLAFEYLGKRKREETLAKMYGPKWKSMMRDIPPDMVKYYALGDVEYPPLIFAKQLERLQEEGLVELFDLERRLTPMLLYMRRLGVRVDLDKAEQVSNEMFLQQQQLLKQYKRLTGREFVDSGKELATAFEALGLKFPRTAKGNPSFKKEWLSAHPHEIAELIRGVRRVNIAKNTFVDGYVLGQSINGRLHATFNQLKGDSGNTGLKGTVTGRFSSANPNLQNIPSRDPILGPLIRGLFLPEEGAKWWSRDWSQVEFRLLVHYAVRDGAQGGHEAAEYYRNDPSTDYHNVVADMTGVERKDAKNLNFGMIYGMGKDLLAANLGRTREEADPIMDQYHERVPFARILAKRMTAKAGRRGYVRTMLGRRRRFPTWEDAKWRDMAERRAIAKEKGDPNWFTPMVDRAEAVKRFGRVKRAFTHKALNSVIQGSAADLMKKAMVDIWESGAVQHLPTPLTVHDELGGSLYPTKESREALDFVQHTMEHCIQLEVPLLAEGSEGRNWAEAK